MKLRIKGNSLRLRLTQGEVRQLAEDGVVEETTRFGANAALVYRLRRVADAARIEAGFAGGVIEVRVPQSQASEWCAGEQVTLAGEGAGTADALRIVVEKDFACLAPRAGEDESDHFPHPAAAGGHTRC